MPTLFKMFGTSHISALLISLIIFVFIILIVRLVNNSEKPLSYFLAAVAIAGYFSDLIYKTAAGTISIHWDLPMQVCDWAAAALVIALLLRKRFFFEIAFYWGLTGTLQALLTPDIRIDFPSVEFILFFVNHSVIVIGALYLAIGLKVYPEKGSVLRSFTALQVYVGSAVLVNILTNSNYGYFMQKPPGGSVLDLMGPWPVYVFAGDFLTLLFFMLLYLPFYIRRGC